MLRSGESALLAPRAELEEPGLSALRPAPADSYFSPGITEWLDLDVALYLGCDSPPPDPEPPAPPPPPPPEPRYCAVRGRFVCEYAGCAREHEKLAHARAHLRRHLGDKPHRCGWDGCAWRFARSDELARHRRSHSGDKPYACPLCVKRFARSDHLAKHARVHARRAARAAAAASVQARRKRSDRSAARATPRLVIASENSERWETVRRER